MCLATALTAFLALAGSFFKIFLAAFLGAAASFLATLTIFLTSFLGTTFLMVLAIAFLTVLWAAALWTAAFLVTFLAAFLWAGAFLAAFLTIFLATALMCLATALTAFLALA